MERSEYLKNYRNQNKEKIKKYNEKYYDKKRKLKVVDDGNETNDKKINDEINKIPNLNFGERMKILREKKKDAFIKKMQDENEENEIEQQIENDENRIKKKLKNIMKNIIIKKEN